MHSAADSDSTAKQANQPSLCSPPPTVMDAAADFQAAIDKLKNENLESLANFQKECGAAISALQRTVDVHGKKIQDVEESLTDACDQLVGLGETVARLTKENEAMKKQLDYLSNYTRRENIRIIGLPESAEMPKPADFVCNLLREVFGPNAFEMPIIIDRVHRTAAPKPPADAKPRPLLVQMHSYRVRELVLRLASRHEGPILYRDKRIHFFPDVSPEVARLRSAFVKRRLHQANITFRLYHPARLVFMWDNQKVNFTEPAEALSFIDRHVPATSGESTSAADT